ncbi:DUF2782 domain-containing protein [Pseudomonas silvicola]|nr:DUF2782 domain-containing protein [Pseudomonas silvicola]
MRTAKRLLLATLLAACPMAVMAADDAPTGDPDVTIRQEGDKTIQEYRQNGFLYAIKVTPKHGKPYFLVRADGTDANYIRSDQPDMLIPAWKIFEWK